MSRFSDHAIDQHNNGWGWQPPEGPERSFMTPESPDVPISPLAKVKGAVTYTAIEPVALSMIVRGLVDRITALERTQHELKARIRELEEPEYHP